MTTIEIVHIRDSDYGCINHVFVDGVRVNNVIEYDVDPGAGHLLSDWRDSIAILKAKDSTAAHFAAEMMEQDVENEYIDNDLMCRHPECHNEVELDAFHDGNDYCSNHSDDDDDDPDAWLEEERLGL